MNKTHNVVQMPLTPRFPNINKEKQRETNISKRTALASPSGKGTSCQTAKSELRSTEKSPAEVGQEYSHYGSTYKHDVVKWARFTLWENEPGKYVVSGAFNWNTVTNKPQIEINFSLKSHRIRDFLRFGCGYEHLKHHKFYTSQKDAVTEERINNWRAYSVSPRITKGYLPKINAGTKSVEFSSFVLWREQGSNYFEGQVQLGYPNTFNYHIKFNEMPTTLQRNATTGTAIGTAFYRPLCRGKWKTKGMVNAMALLEGHQLNIVD